MVGGRLSPPGSATTRPFGAPAGCPTRPKATDPARTPGPLLQAWNLTCCRPALGLTELRKAFDSAGKRGPNPDFHFAAAPSHVAPAPAVPEWPQTTPEMFHGLAGDIVRLIAPHTEADPVALLVQLLAAFGSALGRTAYFTAEADRHFANLFVVLVGISSKGRKGTSWGHIRRLMQLAEPELGNSLPAIGPVQRRRLDLARSGRHRKTG